MKKKAATLLSGGLFIAVSSTYALSILLLPLPFTAKLFISVLSASVMGVVMRTINKEAIMSAEH